jgi:hypothetical protein
MIRFRSLRLPTLGMAIGLAAFSAVLQPAHATTVIDAAGDFLPTYTGPLNGDLDVRSVSARQDGTGVTLSAMLGGAVGATATGVYVWGVNRGAGTQGLLLNSPPVGAGVFFDAVVVLLPNATGQVVAFNAMGPPTTTSLSAGTITVSGDTITGVVPFSLLPSTGFTTANYLYNLWPRSGLASNVQIADFAPDASSFAANVPEPGAWALMIAGLGMVGAALRRRRTAVALGA